MYLTKAFTPPPPLQATTQVISILKLMENIFLSLLDTFKDDLCLKLELKSLWMFSCGFVFF